MGKRAGKLYQDIKQIQESPFQHDFITYVFGRDNLDILESMGFNCKLINDNPIIWDMQTQLWRHKLDIFKAASEDFDEFVFLDWDCRPTAPIPLYFWDVMGERAPLQANLMLYRTKRCLWRTEELRKTCNGGFVYMRGKEVVDHVISNYEWLCQWREAKKKEREAKGQKLRFREEIIIFDDEPAISKFVDDYMGGWPGLESYWEYFESPFSNIKTRKSAYSEERLKSKQQCFYHAV
jgi:hypothetical protein